MQQVTLSTILVASLMLGGAHSPALAAETPHDPAKDARMEWWRDAKFGLFIHWGLYSVPAGTYKGEKTPKNYAEWIMYHMKIPYEEYSLLAKEFNPTQFDADEWAQLAHDAGMGYFILTTKHHDGFALFDSEVSDYDVMDASPFKRDIFGELAEAFRKKDMHVGAYYSHDIDWSHPQKWGGNTSAKGSMYNDWDFDVPKDDRTLFRKYLDEKSLPQVKELSVNYQPDLYWFDIPTMMKAEESKEFLDLVREYTPNVVINGRLGKNGLYGDYKTPGDNGYFTTPQPGDWEAIVTMTESWGYKENPHEQKSPEELITRFSQVVSAGGNFVVNVGPKADGTLADYDVFILKAFADWMDVNSEAIHGTQHNPFQEFFPWGDCTVKGNALYLHVNEWKPGMRIELPRLMSTVSSVELLGDAERELTWKQADGSFDITLTGDPIHAAVSVVKVTFKESSVEVSPLSMATADGYHLESRYALSRGNKMIAMRHQNHNGSIVIDTRTGHHPGNGHVAWELNIEQPGTYTVIAEFEDSTGQTDVEDRTLTLKVDQNKKPALSSVVKISDIQDGKHPLGELEFKQSGKVEIALNAETKKRGSLYLKGFHLIRK
ncbi:MAG: alpha-L-fucosidase [Verrucomicrobiota bacterium]